MGSADRSPNRYRKDRAVAKFVQPESGGPYKLEDETSVLDTLSGVHTSRVTLPSGITATGTSSDKDDANTRAYYRALEKEHKADK